MSQGVPTMVAGPQHKLTTPFGIVPGRAATKTMPCRKGILVPIF